MSEGWGEDEDNVALLGGQGDDGRAETSGLRANDQLRQRSGRQPTAEELDQMAELKYGAESVLSLIKPVSVTMAIVIATIRSVTSYQSRTANSPQLAYAPMHESDNQSTGQRLGGALINVLIFLCFIIVMTFLLVFLFKYRCYRAIHGWLIISSCLLLFMFSYLYISELLNTYNQPFDYFTYTMVVWNFGVAGMFAIHWKGPLIIQQVYLVIISALMALILIKYLPDWTVLMLLGVIALYDLFAVLCPGGPLRMLVETAQERDEPLFPALIYSSAMAWIVTMADADRDVDTFSSLNDESATDDVELHDRAARTSREHRQPPTPQQEEEEDSGGVKLGLGDFIFYSVLVGKAATADDFGTVCACYVAIIIGLVCTLFILSVYQKALPALPISIFFGLIFFFSTNQIITPLVLQLSTKISIM
eukprot:CAMPEP_0182924886 /NCGR_PEP_ID=MMETSP0105_2-20130417/7855_1 /TAXON_ID=81532 ORGANISM="Acanthoeca-like sp., Strain 10tr" /NCGR_SAMPLE_ID=MMETSP0105_2 /ASSEMBLY_ACC=CAM_ASM_000205 /LENGTH=419 /DNA_ID=CAMNT_0025062705 /DNA_START=29 /DNA_END=1288 /DNA_ORIENTATION=+